MCVLACHPLVSTPVALVAIVLTRALSRVKRTLALLLLAVDALT